MAQILQILQIISPISVITGTALVVLQLRVNSRQARACNVLDALSAQPMADWIVFQPIRRHIMQPASKSFPALASNQAGLDSIYWPDFRWLADESRKWTLRQFPVTPGAGTSPSEATSK